MKTIYGKKFNYIICRLFPEARSMTPEEIYAKYKCSSMMLAYKLYARVILEDLCWNGEAESIVSPFPVKEIYFPPIYVWVKRPEHDYDILDQKVYKLFK